MIPIVRYDVKLYKKRNKLYLFKVLVKDQNVLRLNVAMDQLATVHKVDGRRHLANDAFHLLFRQAHLRSDAFKEVTQRRVLLCEHVSCRRLECYVISVDNSAVW